MPARVSRFAEFELDSGRYELRRGDRVLKLEKIPMEILTLLVESNGQLVTRDQITERIWGKGVFLDTEHGINTAIRKIRRTLGDDPEQPRFVQTVTGKGYRFIAPAIAISEGGNGEVIGAAAPVVVPPNPIDSPPAQPQNSRWPRFSRLVLACTVTLALAFVVYFGWWRSQGVSLSNAGHVIIAVLPFENLSGNPNEDSFGQNIHPCIHAASRS